MILYKSLKHKMTDSNHLYRYIIDGITHIQLMPNKNRINLHKEDLYAMLSELEEWEKKNASATHSISV